MKKPKRAKLALTALRRRWDAALLKRSGPYTLNSPEFTSGEFRGK